VIQIPFFSALFASVSTTNGSTTSRSNAATKSRRISAGDSQVVDESVRACFYRTCDRPGIQLQISRYSERKLNGLRCTFQSRA
jgi:hypothetical protein